MSPSSIGVLLAHWSHDVFGLGCGGKVEHVLSLHVSGTLSTVGHMTGKLEVGFDDKTGVDASPGSDEHDDFGVILVATGGTVGNLIVGLALGHLDAVGGRVFALGHLDAVGGWVFALGHFDAVGGWVFALGHFEAVGVGALVSGISQNEHGKL